MNFIILKCKEMKGQAFVFHRDLEEQSDMSKIIRNTSQYNVEPTGFIIHHAAYVMTCAVEHVPGLCETPYSGKDCNMLCP